MAQAQEEALRQATSAAEENKKLSFDVTQLTAALQVPVHTLNPLDPCTYSLIIVLPCDLKAPRLQRFLQLFVTVRLASP